MNLQIAVTLTLWVITEIFVHFAATNLTPIVHVWEHLTQCLCRMAVLARHLSEMCGWLGLSSHAGHLSPCDNVGQCLGALVLPGIQGSSVVYESDACFPRAVLSARL